MGENLPQIKECPECQGDMFLQVQFFPVDLEEGFEAEVSVWVCVNCDYEEDLE